MTLSLLFNLNTLTSIILFLGIPSFYLSFRGPKYIKKSIFFSLIVSIPTIIMIDYIAHLTNIWVIPYSILPFRLFGSVTLEVILWAIFNFYFVIMFYEYFLDKHFTKRLLNPKIKYLILAILIIFLIFIIFLFNATDLLKIPYFYLWFGIILILIPIINQLLSYPALTTKLFKTAAYFFYLTFIYEVTGLTLGWWAFPGTEFIGWVSILWASFPIEEIVFWCILFAMAILSYYEFFEDDEK